MFCSFLFASRLVLPLNDISNYYTTWFAPIFVTGLSQPPHLNLIILLEPQYPSNHTASTSLSSLPANIPKRKGSPTKQLLEINFEIQKKKITT